MDLFLEPIEFFFEFFISNNWYLFTLISLIFYGAYQYFLDYYIHHEIRTLTLSMGTYAIIGGNTFTVVILSSIIFIISIVKKGIVSSLTFGLLLGAVQGILFLFVNNFRFEARKVFSLHIVLPIIKSSIIIIIAFSWIFFGEFASATSSSFVGFFLIGLSIYLLKTVEAPKEKTKPEKSIEKKSPEYIKGLIFLVMATLVSAAISLLAKYAVYPISLNIYLFMFSSNALSCFIALYMIHSEKKKINQDENTICDSQELHSDMVRMFKKGLWLGLLNFVAYACYLKALSVGVASIVIPMYSLYVIIPVILTSAFQGEKLTEKNCRWGSIINFGYNGPTVLVY